jgi:hypothetical protein
VVKLDLPTLNSVNNGPGLLLACTGLTQDSVSRCALCCIERPRRTLTGVLARILRAEQDRTFVSGTHCP